MRLTDVFYATLQATAALSSTNKKRYAHSDLQPSIALANDTVFTRKPLIFNTKNTITNSIFDQEKAPLNFQPPHLEGINPRHTTHRRSATAPEDTNVLNEDLTETGVFRLFNISASQGSPSNAHVPSHASPYATSIKEIVENYLEKKNIVCDHPFIKHLLAHDYLRHPLKLDLIYRIKNNSPDQPSSGAVIDKTKPHMTHSQKELEVGKIMAQATRMATQEISRHTPFSLREAQPGEPADIRLQTKLRRPSRISWSGATSYPANIFYIALDNSRLNVIDNTFTEESAKNVIATFRQQYSGKSKIVFSVGSNFSANVTPGSAAYYLAMHELGHSLGLNDITMPPKGFEGLEAFYLRPDQAIYENSAMAYSSIPNITSACRQTNLPYPQTLMPYDYLALNYFAKYILNSQHADSSDAALQTIIANKSPHRGHTHYHFNPGINSIDIVDHRDGDVRATYSIQQTQQGYVQLTLVDPGGHDTLDFRAFHTPVYIDMQPGGLLRYNTSALALSTAICNDTLTEEQHDLIYNAKGNVYLTLDTDANTLVENTFTGSGSDVVHGNALDNVLSLGKGHDVVSGGKGCDSFIFQRGDGQLTIKDFNATCDRLVLHPNLGVRNHQQLMARTHTTKNGHNLNMHFHHGEKITLHHLSDKATLKPENVLIQAYAENKIRRALV